jgi:EmrB/QacA subfamily drug resistance transporter
MALAPTATSSATRSPNTSAQRGASAPEHRPWRLLVLLSMAQFMVSLDVTVVNVALPSIGRALDFAPGDLQWVVTIYLLLTGGLTMLGGRAADLLGRRRVFLTGLAVFTTASLASGFAPTSTALILARAAQGLGAALLAPAALSIITTSYTGEQRARALGVWGAIASGGAAAGLLVGGVLTTWLSWKWVFLINVPIGAVGLLLALRLIARDAIPPGQRRRFDVPGATAATAGFVAIVYAISGAATNGWGAPRTLLLLGIGVALLGVFTIAERHVARPLVAPAVWRLRSLVGSAAVMLGATAVLGGSLFIGSFLMQQTLGASPLESGLAFLPLAAMIGLSALIGPSLLAHTGPRLLTTGALATAAAGAMLLAAAPANPQYLGDLLPGFLLLGVGIGLAFVAISVTAMADVDAEQAGVASGLMMTAHEIGGALGVAMLSTVAAGAGHGPVTLRIAEGSGSGYVAAASTAAAFALLAVLVMPSARAQARPRGSLHGMPHADNSSMRMEPQ